MTSGQQDRPEDESDDTGQQNEESQEGNFVPGSAADPTMGQGSPEVGVGAYYGQVSSPEERNWSMLLHLSALSGLIFAFVGNWLAPLIIWLIYRAKSDMVDYHGKRALNFQISMTIYIVISFALSFVLIRIPFLIGFSLIWIVWTIVGAVRSSRGDPPGYILSIGFFK